MSEIIYDNVAVASIDMLGFSNQVRTDVRNASKILESMIDSSSKWEGELTNKTDHLSSYTQQNECHIKIPNDHYGDSIFIYGDPEWEIDKQVQKLILFSCYTILSGLLLDKKYLARVGIAIGELLIKEEKGIIIGSAIVKAHELEKSQDWIGGSICIDIDKNKNRYLNPKNDCSLITEYSQLPLKSRSNARNIYALNWLDKFTLSMANCKECDVKRIVKYLKGLIASKIILDEGIKQKYKNTLNFIANMTGYQ